ncbi:MAG: hypothetical protein R3C12_20660 [Planctomycetaceae bacterium]
MCGIVGAISLTGPRCFPEEILERMLDAIYHRGPDDGHSFSEPGIAFGARRLAIIDVAHGRQPISNEDGQVVVAFNGELFDYPELRQQLIAKGHQLKTHCDTEAWSHLYEDQGEEVFLHGRGQFATSIWDRRQQKLLLGRDRVGISPCITPPLMAGCCGHRKYAACWHRACSPLNRTARDWITISISFACRRTEPVLPVSRCCRRGIN